MCKSPLLGSCNLSVMRPDELAFLGRMTLLCVLMVWITRKTVTTLIQIKMN